MMTSKQGLGREGVSKQLCEKSGRAGARLRELIGLYEELWTNLSASAKHRSLRSIREISHVSETGKAVV